MDNDPQEPEPRDGDPAADDPSRWEEGPCRDTPTEIVLLTIALAVLGPLAAASVFAI